MENLRRIAFSLALLSAACSSVPTQTQRSVSKISRPAPVVFLSDFGLQDESVAVCKGSMFQVQPDLKVIDLTHQIPAFSITDAARVLSLTTPYFPEGTVFLALVEKHTEGPKRSLVVKSKKGQFFVLPDNGIITPIKERDGIEEARVIAPGPGSWMDAKAFESRFLGRDVYAVVAARLARGDSWEGVGPILPDVKSLPVKGSRVSETQIAGEVVTLDGPYGNLITNITAANFLSSGYVLGDRASVKIGARTFALPFVKTFDDVGIQELLLYIDSSDHLAIAINQGNFANKFKIKPGARILVQKKRSKKDASGGSR